ncbi:uncharacterized protein [Leptinotarsa decemlineata]|uniref:uncharacterized protein n=1 Tax=Leptinotarsa decemlineata TaxID=7539 RepID=UPI000C2528DA|nr:uncharacterized protein LOC111508771 [Leptinotarsa decemlineata]
MELEAKLDEDFLFYLNFTDTFLRRVPNPELYNRYRVWLHKLCGEPCEGIQKKRCRNIYLANLLISMQNGMLERPFQESPFDVDINNATEVFGPIPDTIEPPEWLNDTEYDADVGVKDAGGEKKGRTYIATRTLPKGQGAFAYIGVSLTDKEPMWLGAGESSFDEKLGEKFVEMVPPQYEMEKILARRKDPREREKVLTFYDVLLQNIADELDGKEMSENETVEGLLAQLIHDLTEREQYAQYEALEESQRRIELLLLLFDRVKVRRDKVAKREEILDDLEEKLMPKSFFDISEPLPEDIYKLPAAMWEQAIDKAPTKQHMDRLLKNYPLPLVKKFLEYLSDYKEVIALRMQRRHENIISQMRKELRKEGQQMKHMAEESEEACENALTVLKAVKEQYEKKMEVEKKNKQQTEVELSDHSKMYEKMKMAVYDTQKMVEEEALRGKFLADQINAVSEQTEQFMTVNDDIVRTTEEANLKILRNIKKLSGAVKQYEGMINELKASAQTVKKQGQLFFF